MTVEHDATPEHNYLPRNMRIEEQDSDEQISAKLRRHGVRLGKGMITPGVFWPSLIIVVALVILAIAAPDLTNTIFSGVNNWIVEELGWYYMLIVGIFVIVAFYLGVSKRVKIRLGRGDEHPDIGLLYWFSMTIASGQGLRL